MTLRERKMAFWTIIVTNVMLAVLGTMMVALFGIVGYYVGGIVIGLISFIPFEIAVLYIAYQKMLDELNDLIERLRAN